MPSPTAFLALWNDLRPGREAEYEAWHTREHVPERVAAPGFRGARRYRCATHPAHRWFTLYDVDGIAAFDTPAYRELLASPTAWSASMRPDFRRFLRAPCRDIARAGHGMGAALAVLRVMRAGLPSPAALDALVAMPGVAAVRLGAVAEGLPSFSLSAESGAGAAFDAVLLIDALDADAARAALMQAASACGASPAEGGVYALAFAFPAFGTTERAAHRRPGWAAEG